MTEQTMAEKSPVNAQNEIPDVYQAWLEVHNAIENHGLEASLRHLVVLRASQINRCGFCVKMHTEEARRDGETSERLDRLVVWDHVDDFTEREKAAFALTDALTELDPRTDFGELRSRLRKHYSEEQIGALIATICMINVWNRLNIGTSH